ncbi:MAG: hypothetical protein VXW70_06220, partial [Candidatus Thermoplasmatota archaeon]|nr:hypothetical protein [Candidatus Thermoplasmatota archaeon]
KFVDGKSEPNKLVTGVKVFKQIWREMTLGVGFWGALRPLVAAILAAIPFLFLGHHFNRKHQKGLDLTLLQIPLALTVVRWFVLLADSILDALREATRFVASINN